MTTDYKFEGWGAFDKNSVKGELKFFQYDPPTWGEDMVDIKILYCGICASDLHTISAGWNPAQEYPQVVGHEIVGQVVKVGSGVTHVKVGDIAGVGAQCDSCLECRYCKDDHETVCDKGQVGTYSGKFYRGERTGDKSYGGYANYNRSPGHFVFKIPDGLDPALAAPMLCGGATLYTPLKQYGAGKSAKDVGIIGIGGLGHFGLLFAKAMGANVTAISHSESKKGDAEKMGATNFIATHGSTNFASGHERSLDLIVSTTNDSQMPISEYLKLLRPGGHLVLVGAPEEDLPRFSAFQLIMSNVHITGSPIGTPKVIREMLDLASTQKIHPWIKKYKLADVNQAVVDMHASKARYRFVLANTDNGASME